MHRRNAISGSRQPLYRWFVGTRRTSSRSGRDGFGEDEGNRRTIDQTGRREIASGRRRRRSWRVAEEWPGSIVGGPGGWRAKGERRRVHVFGEPLRPVRDWPQPLQMHRALHCTALQLRLSPYVMPLRVLFRALAFWTSHPTRSGLILGAFQRFGTSNRPLSSFLCTNNMNVD